MSVSRTRGYDRRRKLLTHRSCGSRLRVASCRSHVARITFKMQTTVRYPVYLHRFADTAIFICDQMVALPIESRQSNNDHVVVTASLRALFLFIKSYVVTNVKLKSPKKFARLLCSHVYLMPVQLSFLFKK